jgi:predicted O-methyltransferase YrrM
LRIAKFQIGIVDQTVERYLESLAPASDEVLLELERYAAKRSVPIVGPLVARLISLFLKSCRAEKVLEVGTAIGYSGIWITRSLRGENKKLTTIELDPNMRKNALANFEKAKIAKYVEIVPGDARGIVPELAKKNQGVFDAVFLDVGDKTLYVDLLDSCITALRVGGFLFADNTLWGGSVAVAKDKSPETRTIRKFNELAYKDKRLETAIIPLRDGLTVAYKRNQ